MLRVGLTGGLGSGKSTVAAMLGELGAHVLSADELGRAMMEPGEPVFRAIVQHFGSAVRREDGRLHRGALARLAFDEGRVEELNAIVHPPVIARQAEIARELEAREPSAVLIVESALLFEIRGAWRDRFERIVLVMAAEQTKIARYVGRTAASDGGSVAERAAEARRRLSRQIGDEQKAGWADSVIRNDGSLEELRQQVERVWRSLKAEAAT